MKHKSIISLILISTALFSVLYIVRQRTEISIDVNVAELTLVSGKKRHKYSLWMDLVLWLGPWI